MADDALRVLQARLDLNRRIDDLVEQAMRSRHGLSETMGRILPALCEATGARGAFIHTFSEELELTLLRYPADLVVPGLEGILDGMVRTPVTEAIGSDHLFVRTLDVAGEWFGCAGVLVPKDARVTSTEELHSLLETACEEIDNFLCSIRAAREKHRVIMRISDALRHRILNEGLQQAMRALAEGVPIDRLLLVCANDEYENQTPHVQVYRGGELELDTMGSGSLPDEPTLRSRARTLLRVGDRSLLQDLGFQGELEEVLINGIVDATVVGKMFVTSKAGTFNTHDRDLLSGFAGFVRQRIIDFNKEWRTLSRSFRADDVARLLAEDHYVDRFLAPREAQVAVLYADICGFTQLSEQVLRTPSAVGHLVEAWSEKAVSLVWQHGGVFDKMVGDCIIALFGPPFYEETPQNRLLHAIHCASAIREMTQQLPNTVGFEHLHGFSMGVSSGVNLASLFVGRFGPNDNFTGFSSGMNNTARLQGCAVRNEILVMSNALEVLDKDHDLTLGTERSARVKNVEHPLRFRAVD
jgi:class 3 adenylate cyclase